MRCLIRYTSDPAVPVTAPDSDPRVKRGEATEVDLFEVRLLPPVSPTKIVCVGRNYREHARELGNAVPTEPLIFLKPVSSLNAPGAPIIYPKLTQHLSYEGELGVVIGTRARNLTAANALSCVMGYTVVNDVTARDLQKSDSQWTRGKGFDTFCPVGPWVVPKEDVDALSLRVITRVNGTIQQDAPVSDMLFPVAAIIEYVTQFMTLEPGDLIATGTPPGVGPLAPGDEVEIEIPGIGSLSNSVVEEV
jgi:2-keto-4-pentenoate hydratase/2-oxohepta-3-ene-1,7-dioic acid hydratase in catechol pathway